MLKFLKKKEKCPYCGTNIEKEHKSKFKCPSCKEEIYVRTSDGKFTYHTKEDFDTDRQARKEKAEINKYYRFFEQSSILEDREYLEERRLDWLKKYPYRGNYDDLTWGLAHEIIKAYFEHAKYREAGNVYAALARFQFDRKQPFSHLQYEALKMQLYDYKYSDGLVGMKYTLGVMTCGAQSCPACRELEGREFTLDEALDQMPLPVKGCTHEGGYCRCLYTVKISRNK